MRMWMLGENPEPQKVNRPVRKFSQGGRWLPIAGLERTGLVLDRFSIPDKPKPISERQKRLQRRSERQRQIMEGPRSAAHALQTAKRSSVSLSPGKSHG
jgi:hypothetical protein